jgi:hypothetical protein
LGTSETRGTDVTVQQAQAILDKAIRSELGRPPKPGEVAQLLAAQGLKPGDRWVGNGGLTGLLNAIRTQGQAGAAPQVFTGRG